jgi:hypothetical protein
MKGTAACTLQTTELQAQAGQRACCTAPMHMLWCDVDSHTPCRPYNDLFAGVAYVLMIVFFIDMGVQCFVARHEYSQHHLVIDLHSIRMIYFKWVIDDCGSSARLPQLCLGWYEQREQSCQQHPGCVMHVQCQLH